jgi:hypothetical protein
MCRVPFSYFARPNSFLAVSRASGPIFMFCAPRLIFGGTEGVRSHFHVLCSRTHFRWCRVRRVPFSCFSRPDSSSTVPRASGPFSCFVLSDSISAVSSVSGPVFIFCPLGLIFGGTEGVGSHFHVLRARTRFRRYQMRRVSFSWFARPDSFLTVSSASGPVFMFCVPKNESRSAKNENWTRCCR